MVIEMIKQIKKVVTPIFLSIICGAICGRLIYQVYDKKLATDIVGEKIYLIQAGAYQSYDSMVHHTSISNYIYYKDQDGLFKSIIGLTENQKNIEKIKSTYQDKVIVSQYYSKDKELNRKIKEYDQKIAKTTNSDEVKKIVLEMLTLYKDNETTLTQIIS